LILFGSQQLVNPTNGFFGGVTVLPPNAALHHFDI
jgi:hypothetical protein